MSSLRSVVLTLQLMVLMADACLPLFSHQWIAARVWHTHAVIAVEPSPAADTLAEAGGAVLDPHGIGGTRRWWLVNSTDLWSDLLLMGAQLLLLLCSLAFWGYIPRRFSAVFSSPPNLIIDLPPPDVPPRLVPA